MSETTQLTVVERAALALNSAENRTKLRELAAQSKTIVEIKNKAAREQCHSAAMVLRTRRTDIRKTGKAAREDATAFQKAVIAEEDALVSIIEPEETRLIGLRDVWDEREAAEKAAKAEAERVRVNAIRIRIDEMRSIPSSMIGKSAEHLARFIEGLEKSPVELEVFAEFSGEAEMAKNAALGKLREMLTAQQAHEAEQDRIKAERAELERLRAEAEERERAAAAERAEAERKAKLARDREEAERRERDVRERAERQRIDNIRERIAAIKATVAMQAGKPSASIESAISALQAMDMSGFDEFFDEAEQARHDATVNLGEMVASVRAMEQAQAEIARQQAELAAAKAEQERVEREAREAAEAKAKAEALEAAHVEALAENARIDAERAAVKKKLDAERAAEIERAWRAQEEFEKNGPGDVEMVKVLAEHYDVTVGDVMGWMKKFDYSAADEQLAAENVKANRLEAA